MENNIVNGNVGEYKLTFVEKFAYGLGDLGNGLMFQFAQLFLLKFYTDVLQIPAYWGGLIFLVAKFFDAFVDTGVGTVVDLQKKISSKGKFRPFILYGTVFLGLSTIACFIAPNMTTNAKIVYAFITYNVMGIFYSIVNIPYGSLSAAMTMDAEERTSLAAFRNFGAQIASLLTGAVVIQIVAKFASPSKGYLVAVIVFALLGVLSQLLCYLGTKERIINSKPHEKGDGAKAIKELFKNKPFIILAIFTILSIGAMFLKSGMQLYYFQYVLGNEGIVSVMSILSSIAIVPAILFSPKLVTKIGKKNVAIFGTFGFAICEILNYLVFGGSTVSYLIVNTISFMFLGFSNTVAFAFVNDVIEYGQLKTGIRSEGIIYSGYSFVRKISQGIAGFVPGLALSMIGYVANQAQSEATLHGMSVIYFLIPAVTSIISIVIFYFGYDLTDEKHQQIVDELTRQNQL